MDLTSLEDHTCNTKRTRCCAGPGRRRHDRLRSHSDGNKRRTNRPASAFFANYQARRRLPLLIRAIAFVATVARGGVLASSNPLELNGGSCLAMAGKDCVALAVDRRFGLEGQLVSTEAKRVLKINGQLLCGFTGLWTDALTVMQDLSSEVALKSLEEGDRPISPAALAGLLSTLLYSRRGSPFFVEPIVAGLDSRGKPYICGQDILGAPVEVDDFVVAGTSAQSLYGTCEAFFRVGMEREELFRAASRCLLSALERDCLSGYGAVVHLITEDGIESRELTTRMD
ncbi:unnamed protein product [Pylaiella littoralis]